MRIFTLLTALLLVAAMLPWGSFVPKFGNGAARHDVLQAQAAQSGTVAPARAVTAQKFCKGPVLPGSPCGPVLAVLSDAFSLAFVQPVVAVAPPHWLRPDADQPPPLLGPPRHA